MDERGLLSDLDWTLLNDLIEEDEPRLWDRLVQHDTLRDTRERILAERLTIANRDLARAREALRPFGIFARLEDQAHTGHETSDEMEVLRSSQVGPVYKTLTVRDFRVARIISEEEDRG